MYMQSTHTGRTAFGPFRILGASLAQWARRCAERARQRHALAELDDRLLQDVGLSRDDVTGEVEKPFWQA